MFGWPTSVARSRGRRAVRSRQRSAPTGSGPRQTPAARTPRRPPAWSPTLTANRSAGAPLNPAPPT